MVTLSKLPAADLEELQLIQLNAEFCLYYGPEQAWVPFQWEQYADAKAAIHKRYAKRRTS